MVEPDYKVHQEDFTILALGRYYDSSRLRSLLSFERHLELKNISVLAKIYEWCKIIPLSTKVNVSISV